MAKPISQSKAKDYTLFYLLLVVLAFSRSLIAYVFIISNGFAPGGVGGISSIIYNAVLPYRPDLAAGILDPGVTTLIMNIPLLIVAFFRLNKRFALHTLLVVLIYSGFMYLFGAVNFPKFIADDSGLLLLASLTGGVINGVICGLMLKNNMSMGGTDILGKLIYKHNPAIETHWIIFGLDFMISFAAGTLGILKLTKGISASEGLTLVLKPIIYSVISMLVSSQIADQITAGLQSSLVFNIISDHPNEIAEQLVKRLHRGVTISHGIGFYTGKEHEVLTCVTSKRQINKVKDIIAETDPSAFTFITKAHEVRGNGFRRFD
ncbi:MAG: YitT family protein [Clostridia bacterium]|nr:YitT family protein [Clostridia bacterium]